MECPQRICVIDVGSNSIKSLVAERTDGPGRLRAVYESTIETRIGTGLGKGTLRIAPEIIAAAIATITELLDQAKPFTPHHTIITATSAVREAANGKEVAIAIQSATGHPLLILEGTDEANLIALGIACDPALAHVEHLRMIDLGGGSLEISNVAHGAIDGSRSFPLGAVRITERFISKPEDPIPQSARDQIDKAVRMALAESAEMNAQPLPWVGLGGAFTIARAIVHGDPYTLLAETSPTLAYEDLSRLCENICAKPLNERTRISGLPQKRADIMPAALQTIVTVMDRFNIATITHSLFNLRYGVARKYLDSQENDPPSTTR